MSRIQLALNVDDLDAAIDFYGKLFAAEPAKVRPGYANFAIAEPPLKLVLIENAGQGGTLNHLGVEVASTDEVGAAQARLARPRSRHHGRGRRVLLLRQAGQGVGGRAVGRAVGDLHRAGRRRDAGRPAPHGRPGDRRDVLRDRRRGRRRHRRRRRPLLLGRARPRP